jgi:16S rRNA (uracil1498-N3)-methyltransferase
LSTVLRLGVGEQLAVFNRADGEWLARITDIRKKEMTLIVQRCLRAPSPDGMKLMVCFAPIKGGRMETIIEMATQLGASVLQPVITQRTIVDKVNIARAETIAREAAEQCERIDWPEIREPVKLLNLLGDWPSDMPLIYGDESGGSRSIHQLVTPAEAPGSSLLGIRKMDPGVATQTGMTKNAWAVLAGPEGGFTPDEFAALGRVKAAVGVGLGPRILRADTAVITLCVATLMAWGDWDERPRFVASGD